LVVSKGLTEDAVKRLVSQKITLDEHAQILHDHTARLDRIETMLAQILTRLKEMPSVLPSEQEREEPAPRRERTFFERMMGIFPEDIENEKEAGNRVLNLCFSSLNALVLFLLRPESTHADSRCTF
jgi:uncharacterized coiled-coil protein SlyX